jgi:hypothetical protein
MSLYFLNGDLQNAILSQPNIDAYEYQNPTQ